jgi:Spy/CpxP family protein refolding chaperone
MNLRRTTFIAFTIAMGSTLAMAQGHQPPPKIDIAAVLNVDAAKAAQVQAILDGGRSQMKALREQGKPTDDASREKMHEAMEAIHKDTDTKLAAILTPDQLAKLKAALPRPPRPDHAQRNPQ